MTVGNSTPPSLRVTESMNVSHLTTLAPQMIMATPNSLKTVVRVKLGRMGHLPCKCSRFNVGGNNPPIWKNSQGEDVLAGSEVDTVPREKRKYLLYNDMRWLTVKDDCSLVVRNVTWEDQGEYTCTYFEPEFKVVPFVNVWTGGYITRHVVVMIKDLSSVGALTVATRVQERVITVTTPRVNITQFHTSALDTTSVNKSVQVTTSAMTLKEIEVTTTMVTTSTSVTLGNTTHKVGTRVTFDNKMGTTFLSPVNVTEMPNVTLLNFKEVVDVTQQDIVELSVNSSEEVFEKREQIVNESDVDSSIQGTIPEVEEEFFDFDRIPEDMTDHYRALQKRETKWKAYGFDSSVLQIVDPWAGRNLWYQQLTHSVRSVGKLNCPCVVKVPTPSTWPSVLETVPEPLLAKCQSYVLSWLLYQQKSVEDAWMALSVHLFRPKHNCSWLRELPYVNLLDQHENMIKAIPDALEVKSVAAEDCFCSKDGREGPGVFMGISECDNYMMNLGESKSKTMTQLHRVSFQIPHRRQNRVLMVRHQNIPGNVTIGNFKDIWWVCGDKAYIFLPYGWTGCCYMATLKLPYEVFTIQKGEVPDEVQSNVVSGSRRKREMAQFHKLESYHWRISLGEKWGIGLFPWYGVTFLADHIDNFTYTLQGFANETIRGFEYLTNTQKSHRLTLLKHDMALDYLLAKQGGLCMALNLTGDAGYTLVPDSTDNMTSVIDALKHIRDAFGPSEGAGWSANAWLQEKFGPLGAMLAQVIIAALISLCLMFCFCTLLLTCAKAMLLRWIGVVMPGNQVQMPLLRRTDSDDDEEVMLEGELVEKYPF